MQRAHQKESSFLGFPKTPDRIMNFFSCCKPFATPLDEEVFLGTCSYP
ncbi:hypothetical protein ASZ90_000991 [hydrocarbon metagenome]|uniref:Uncharacterized protein n=1 Tax=hydrocarbon metagenome TaxID=938273 RepID=A0A0W8G9G0_9ZZZZ